MKWLLKRLHEPSTWRGLVWLATFAGLSLRPDQADAIVAVGIAVAGLLGVFTSDAPKPDLPPVELQARPMPAVDLDLGDGAERLRRIVQADRERGFGAVGRNETVERQSGWNG